MEQAGATNTASDGTSLPPTATTALSTQDQKIYQRLQNVSNSIEEEIDKNGKASTNDKVELLRGVKQTPMQKVLTESNPRGTDKFEVSREILEFDKQFFQRQLNRIAKSYQAEIRTQQMKARDKAIEYVERNMFLAKETLQKELTHLQAQFQESKQEIEGMRRHAKFYEGALSN